jgi:hypothetical protein
VVDVASCGLRGKLAEQALDGAGITVGMVHKWVT